MEREQESSVISNLVFELTMANSTTPDLDVLLARLFEVLRPHHDLQLEPRGAILLLSPRGRYIQVAQFGMEPVWNSRVRWDAPAFRNSIVAPSCRTQDILLSGGAGASVPARSILLPLHVEGRGIGYIAMFASPGYEMGGVYMGLMDDLALALSGLVQHALTNETLSMRELELEDARADALRSLWVASGYRDNETGWHIMRMANFAQAIAKAMGLPEAQRELLYVAAPMHDVGKIGIDDAVLRKPGKLTPEEFEIMKTHTDIGVTILNGKDALIAAARDIAGSHHECWDGSGYPRGLKGVEIPLLARICAVADVFDALTSPRPYKESWAVPEAQEWIESRAGKHFDPVVVQAFLAAMPEILRIRELYRDDIINPKQALTLSPIKHREDAWIPWDDELNVGIGTIDEHHRYLFDLLNDLHTVVVNKGGARQVARLVKALDAYAKIHFRAEEQMMAHYGYEGMDRQLHQHHAFEEKIGEFYEELHANPMVAQFDVLIYLRDWLIGHIRVEDAQLAALTRA